MSDQQRASRLVVELLIRYHDSVCVGQFAKMTPSRIVRSFSRVSGSGESNHGNHGSQLSQSDSAPPSFVQSGFW